MSNENTKKFTLELTEQELEKMRVAILTQIVNCENFLGAIKGDKVMENVYKSRSDDLAVLNSVYTAILIAEENSERC